jgi:putative transposase
MPQNARAIQAGVIYHVLNRGNGRMRLFRKDEDYAAFERVLAEGLERYPVDLLTYCLMPSHWHLVLRPREANALGRLMGWVGVTHVRRHHEHYHTRGGGHLYQGRFKSFPVQESRHFLLVCRYVEANAARAKLADRAERWRWSGLWRRLHGAGPDDAKLALCAWPVRRPGNWLALANQRMGEEQLSALRTSVNRSRPYGEPDWVRQSATLLGLEHTLRNPGRPKKQREAGGGWSGG